MPELVYQVTYCLLVLFDFLDGIVVEVCHGLFPGEEGFVIGRGDSSSFRVGAVNCDGVSHCGCVIVGEDGIDAKRSHVRSRPV